MLEHCTVDTFRGRIGEVFRILTAPDDPDRAALETVLVAARTWGEEHARGRGRVPFAVEFRGPLRPILPQRTYRFEHADLGAFDLFIVPVGPDAEGMRYEAVFS